MILVMIRIKLIKVLVI